MALWTEDEAREDALRRGAAGPYRTAWDAIGAMGYASIVVRRMVQNAGGMRKYPLFFVEYAGAGGYEPESGVEVIDIGKEGLFNPNEEDV